MNFELDEEVEKIFTAMIYRKLQDTFTPELINEMVKEFSKEEESTRITGFMIKSINAKVQEQEDKVGLNLKLTLEPTA